MNVDPTESQEMVAISLTSYHSWDLKSEVTCVTCVMGYESVSESYLQIIRHIFQVTINFAKICLQISLSKSRWAPLPFRD